MRLMSRRPSSSYNKREHRKITTTAHSGKEMKQTQHFFKLRFKKRRMLFNQKEENEHTMIEVRSSLSKRLMASSIDL